MNKHLNFFVVLSLSFVGIAGCKFKSQGLSSIAVTNSEPVTRPDQAPGTYRIQYYTKDPKNPGSWIEARYGGAAVLVSEPGKPATFLTVAHNLEEMQGVRTSIVDYKNNIVADIRPGVTDVRLMVNPNYTAAKTANGGQWNQTTVPANDIGAIVFAAPLKKEPEQGSIRIVRDLPTPGQDVTIVGAGASSSLYYGDRDNPERQNQATAIMRVGTNKIELAQMNGQGTGSLLRIDGNAIGGGKADDGTSIGLPGDSGGSIRGPRGAYGLVSTGLEYDPSKPVDDPTRWINIKSKEGQQVADQYPNGKTVGVTFAGQEEFFNSVSAAGGSIQFAGDQANPKDATGTSSGMDTTPSQSNGASPPSSTDETDLNTPQNNSTSN